MGLMRPADLTRRRLAARLSAGVLGALLAVSLVAACDDESDDSSADFGCELVDESVAIDVLGDGLISFGELRQPDLNSDCEIQKRSDPDGTYLTIVARYPSESELDSLSGSWPRTVAAAHQDGCHQPWISPEGETGLGFACVERDPGVDGEFTRLGSVWGDLSVTVEIARPQAKPGDAEAAYRVAANVAEHMNAE